MVFVEVIFSLCMSMLLLFVSGVVANGLVNEPSHEDLVWWGTLKLLETLVVAYVIFNWITK